MIPYKRLTEIDKELEDIGSFVDDIKKAGSEAKISFRPSGKSEFYTIRNILPWIVEDALKDIVYHELLVRIQSLEKEKEDLLGYDYKKKWWQFWKK